MTQQEQYDSLVEDIKKEFKSFEVVPKENSFWMKLLFNVSLMRLWNKRFMTHYITTMGGKVYMPTIFIGTYTGAMVLRHERVHLRDSKKYPVLFELSYLFFPLPILVTGRAFWEYRGYCESLLAEYDRLGHVRKTSIDYYVSLFCNSEYLWMFPFRKFLTKKFTNFCANKGIQIT